MTEEDLRRFVFPEMDPETASQVLAEARVASSEAERLRSEAERVQSEGWSRFLDACAPGL